MELADRYARSDAARGAPEAFFEFRRGLIAHDVDRIRAALPDDFVFHDHRRTGLGRIESADEYMASLVALFEQSPDAIIEPMYEVATAKHGALMIAHTLGTLAEGGAFESVFVNLALSHGDRLVAVELFELEDLDVARARFEELRPDPLRIPPNAACRAHDRVSEARVARNWPALRAPASDDFVYEDRRKRALLAGDVELWIESLKFYGSAGQFAYGLIATAGDRIAIERSVLKGEPDGVAVEVEFLLLTEIDANGRHVAVILFDPDDRRAAFDEAQVRFLAGEAAGIGGQAPIVALIRTYVQHDWAGVRACLAHDFVFRDHRTPALMGVLDCDQWVESMRAHADLAPDLAGEQLHIVAWNHHGRVAVNRLFGTPRDGGPFENVFIGVIATRGDRIQAYEVFDLGAADQALARFEELCADLPSASRSA
jgi:ketosteroid isomerase-like protein